MLDVFQNQASRLITGSVKTTAILAMLLLCDLQSMTSLVWSNAAIPYNRLTRLPNTSFWREYDFNRSRNLKSQKGFLQYVREIAQYNAINDNDYELLSGPLEFMVLDIRLDLTLNVRKSDLFPNCSSCHRFGNH
ncbi:hypothetical protein TNCT_681461 [Trichonephila clavata]|uniref:Uncharacterized protein n=1 Tax=Trichonephila clavata TaxID=2740835 RepID=A0A8X6H5G9_TRICU|nr:hypothetical protein TNCT_681461 [Trichonephila clavata]